MFSKISEVNKRFKVKVYRCWGNDEEGYSYDGWFVSDVFAISSNNFLVYDNGEGSSDLKPQGFIWVDYLDVIPDCSDNCKTMIPRVELLADQE